MKKVYLLFLAIMIAGSLMGQNVLTFPSGKLLDQKTITKIKPHQSSSAVKDNSRWYNYGDAIDLLLNGTGEYASNYLFPDSTMQVVYIGGVLGGTWIHKLAEVFDPTVMAFNDVTYYPGELSLKKTSSYTLDSIEFYCLYLRGHKSPTSVDTLIIDVAVKNFPTASSISYFGPTSTISINLGTDTTKFIRLAYNQATNSFDVNPHSTYKIPLTVASANDTLPNGLNVFGVAPNLTINSNQHFYVSVSFKPGYVWVPNADSMIAYNRCRFLSIDENLDNFPVYTKGDWNVSYILPQDVRYNTASSWNGYYIPSFAYMGGTTNTYSYTHHAIYYKCTGVSDFGFVSVNENENVNDLLGNAFPNPINGNNDLIIPVNTEDATVIISDVFGKEVFRLNKIINGKISVNTTSLSAGLYFYTLQSGKNSVTKKFTVAK